MMVEALVATAGSALVQAMVTDGWEGVRHKVARLFGRGEPDPAIERRLDATRQELAAASPAELSAVQAALAAQWQTRFADLLADRPEAEAGLAGLVGELTPVTTAASDHAVAAGRDVHVSADHGGVAAGVIGGDVTLPGPTSPGPAGR
jgi:hypothetical protein